MRQHAAPVRGSYRGSVLAAAAVTWLLGALLVIPSGTTLTGTARAALQAPYPPVAASVSLSRGEIGLGECSDFSGNDWKPGVTVVIRDRGQVVSSPTISADGTFTHPACYQTASGCGTHRLTATGQQADGSTVTLGATLQVICSTTGPPEPVQNPPQAGGQAGPVAGGSETGGPLPFTGFPVPAQVALLTIFGLLGVGALLLALGRRRQHEQEAQEGLASA